MIKRRTFVAGMAASVTGAAVASRSVAAPRPVRLGQIGLSFYAVVAGVVRLLLERAGHEVEVVEGAHADIYPRLGRGEVSAR